MGLLFWKWLVPRFLVYFTFVGISNIINPLCFKIVSFVSYKDCVWRHDKHALFLSRTMTSSLLLLSAGICWSQMILVAISLSWVVETVLSVGLPFRSSTRYVFARSNTGIVVSNPTQGMGCLKTKLRGLSPQANYTDRATAACRWS
jgi:hypothetical protein